MLTPLRKIFAEDIADNEVIPWPTWDKVRQRSIHSNLVEKQKKEEEMLKKPGTKQRGIRLCEVLNGKTDSTQAGRRMFLISFCNWTERNNNYLTYIYIYHVCLKCQNKLINI